MIENVKFILCYIYVSIIIYLKLHFKDIYSQCSLYVSVCIIVKLLRYQYLISTSRTSILSNMYFVTNQFPFANIRKLLIGKLSYFARSFVIHILYYKNKKNL